MRFNELSRAQRIRLDNMCTSGATMEEIADRFGIHTRTAYTWCTKYMGYKRNPPKSKNFERICYDPVRLAEFVNDFKSGKTRHAMMKKYGIGKIVYYKILDEAGLRNLAERQEQDSIRSTRANQDIEIALRIKQLSKQGLTNSEIAEKLNISEEIVISNIGLHGFNGGRKPKPQVIQTLPIGTKVWALQPTNTRNLTLSYKKVPVTIEKVYPRFYDCVTDNGYHVSVQIAGAKRVMQ